MFIINNTKLLQHKQNGFSIVHRIHKGNSNLGKHFLAEFFGNC